MEFLNRVIWNLTVSQWLIFLGVTALLAIVLRIVKGIVRKRMSKFVNRTKTDLDDLTLNLLKLIHTITLVSLSVWLVQLFLPFSDSFKTWSRVFFLCVLYLQIGFWIRPVYTYLLGKVVKGEKEQSRQASISMMVKILSWITYIILGVMAIDTLPGVEATTLIATLGIGGIAIGFALQSVLSDFASALTIAFDQPFEEGDGIVVDGLGGTVEKIGLKSTRLRSWDGQEVVIANSDLLSSRINNYKTMERRRVVLNFGVVYQTTADDLERIPSLLEQLISGIENVTYARTHSTLLNSSSIDYECVYYVESADFNLFMDIRHQVNVALIRRFEEEGIEFAYPTQTIFVEK